MLALRVFPENDRGPYRTLWHRDPAGSWSIHVDGARLDIAVPTTTVRPPRPRDSPTIELTWTGPSSLRVHADPPGLEWTLTASEPATLRLLNAIGARLPLWPWRPHALLRIRERLARRLGMGDLQLSGVMPSGHVGTLMPQRMYFVEESTATLEEVDLGRPAHWQHNPTIGEVPLPARGVLAIGQAAWRILDPVEYERTRREPDDPALARKPTKA